MATEEALRSITLTADSSLAVFTGVPGQPGSASPNSGKQYRFVKITGTRQAGLCTAATDIVCGINQGKPQNAGNGFQCGFSGVSKVTAGAAVSAGDLVAPDSTGRAVTDGTHGKWQALEPAAAAGDIISVFRVL